MWESFKTFIHNISDWLEALGFIAGIITVVKVFLINRDVNKIQEKHLFQVRVDEHIIDLKKNSKKLSGHLDNYKINIRDIKLEISKCIEHCVSVSKKVSEKDLANLKPLIKKMKRLIRNKVDLNSQPNFIQKILKKKPIAEVDIDEVYTQLNSLIAEIENFNNDLKKTIK